MQTSLEKLEYKANMKFVWIAAALLVTIVGKSVAVSHLKCNAKEYELPGVQEIRAKCNDGRSEACTILCTYKAVGMVNHDHTINETQSIATISSYPEGVRGTLGAALAGCGHLMAGLPSQIDEECTVLEPLYKCGGAVVKRSGCEILTPSFFY